MKGLSMFLTLFLKTWRKLHCYQISQKGALIWPKIGSKGTLCIMVKKIIERADILRNWSLTFPNWVRPLCCGIAPGLSALEQSALKWEFNLNVRFRWYPFWHYYSQSTDVKSFHTTKHIEFFTWSNDQTLIGLKIKFYSEWFRYLSQLQLQ